MKKDKKKKKFNWKRFFKRAGIIALAIVITFIVFDAAIAIYMYTDLGAIPTSEAKYPAPHIKNVVWPTICNPAMVKPGGTLDIEVDLRSPSSKKSKPGSQPADAGNWQVTVTPIEEALAGITRAPAVEKAWTAPSSKWPEGSRNGASDSVWHLTCRMPADTPAELYNLKVTADVEGKTVSDGQPHSVSVTNISNGNFRYVTFADIHVHERNIGGLLETITNKGIARDGTPLFFQTAIDEVNLISPDFVVLVGDFIYAQRFAGEYQKEFAKFFAQLSRFEVPVFAVPGNHDLYVNQVDGKRVWEENIGPLYYSFDVGGTHFTCLDTFEWPTDVRTVCSKFGGLFMFPRTGRGKVVQFKNGNDISTYKQQLQWVAGDLKDHKDSGSRVIFAHHDPFRQNGKGSAYTQKFQGIWPLPGNNGRAAIRNLCAKYDVNLLMSGHMHSDSVGKAPWYDKKGQTVFANQTCVYFDKGGDQNQYPGYRLVNVSGGSIKSYSYVDEFHSIPIYDGSNLKGKTDLDNIIVPALSSEEAPELENPDQPGVALIRSYLAVPMKVRGVLAVVPASGEYQVLNGTVYQSVPLPNGTMAIYIEANVPAGKPGASASSIGKPTRLWVAVHK